MRFKNIRKSKKSWTKFFKLLFFIWKFYIENPPWESLYKKLFEKSTIRRVVTKIIDMLLLITQYQINRSIIKRPKEQFEVFIFEITDNFTIFVLKYVLIEVILNLLSFILKWLCRIKHFFHMIQCISTQQMTNVEFILKF